MPVTKEIDAGYLEIIVRILVCAKLFSRNPYLGGLGVRIRNAGRGRSNLGV